MATTWALAVFPPRGLDISKGKSSAAKTISGVFERTRRLTLLAELAPKKHHRNAQCDQA